MEFLTLALVLLGLILAVLWVFLPFLVNGTNRRLDRLIDEVKALRNAVERQRL